MKRWLMLALLCTGLNLAHAQPAPASAPASAAARFPSAIEVCTKQTYPRAPSTNFVGQVAFDVIAYVEAGKVVAVDIKQLTTGLDRQSAKAFIAVLHQALAGYECPGVSVFQQEFLFRLR